MPEPIKTRRSFVTALTSISLILSGCAHVPNVESKSVQLPKNPAVSEQVSGDVKIASVMYVSSKLPLEDFFQRLRHGEFNDAFAQMDLNYKESNVNDMALKDLISEGFIPVYIDVTNNGSQTIDLTESHFQIDNGKRHFDAFKSDDVPREFKRFNPDALAANTFNIGIIVIGTVAVIAALVILTKDHGGSSSPNFIFISPSSSSESSTSDSSNDVLNDLSKTTYINYKSYLFSAKNLQPGESTRGLLFFRIPSKYRVGLHDYKLVFH